VSSIIPDSEPPLYQSDLAQTPLPEILIKVHRYKAPGRIDCQRGEVMKRIYLEDGQIVFAATNQTAESLGDRLLAAGRITREEYESSLKRSQAIGKRHGVTLVDMKILSAKELFQAVRAQIEEIVWSMFAWDSGTVRFTPGREKHHEFVKVDIAVPRAILQGVQRMSDARALLARMGTKSTVLERTNEQIEGLTLTDEEQALLTDVDGKRSLLDLVNLHPNSARMVYGLFVIGLVRIRGRHPIKVQIKTKRPDE
jgi:hypothetical protein